MNRNVDEMNEKMTQRNRDTNGKTGTEACGRHPRDGDVRGGAASAGEIERQGMRKVSESGC